MSGAVDFAECPNVRLVRCGRKAMRRVRGCPCGTCAICGYPKHSGVHGAVNGALPGSAPWGHEYVPATRSGEPNLQTGLQSTEIRKPESPLTS